MITYRLQPLRGIGSMGFISMGQQDSSWTPRAQAAVARYDTLIKRTASIQNDAVRADILSWIGTPTMPGSPADRYQFVKDDLESGAAWDVGRTAHVTDLEAVDTELDTRVSKGEQSGTFTSTSPVSIVTPQGQLSPLGIGLLAGAAACLVVVPLFVLK